MDYQATGPYPVIAVDGRNPAYARAMLSNIGGQHSELSAVGMYFYSCLESEQKVKEVSDAFHHIMIVEMHHLKLFGELAKQLGADPRLWEYSGGNHVYWSSRYINYHRDVDMMLRQSVKNEELTIRRYQAQQARIKDPCVCDVLGRVIEDETLHLNIFKGLLGRD